jgi:putative nucleotidyltransferase with HDIG domain
VTDRPADRAGRPPGTGSALVARAREMAGGLLEGLDDQGRRWRHTVAVAARARQAAPTFAGAEAEVLEAAAWLHDVGYAPAAARSGFHPVDGADYVRSHLGNDAVAGLIAQHSGACFVAAARGMSDLMLPFARPGFRTGPVADALTWADQTTGPDGGTVTVEQRLHETLVRHGPDSPNARAHAERAPAIIAAVHATEARLAAFRDRAGGGRTGG